MNAATLIRQWPGRRAAIHAKLAEIPSLRRALSDLRSIILAHRAAIVAEEDRTGPRLVAIAARLESHLEALQKLGRDVDVTDRQLAKAQGATSGLGQIIEWLILLGTIGGLIGVNLSLGYIQSKEADTQKARAEIAKTVGDLKARGADPAVIKALTGVYDGLGGAVAQTGETLLRVGLVAGVGFIGWKLFEHFSKGRHR